jgi:hypothetical protein
MLVYDNPNAIEHPQLILTSQGLGASVVLVSPCSLLNVKSIVVVKNGLKRYQ